MSLKIQFNKTFIQYLQKQLAMRVNALPTLKNKETALRIEVQGLTRQKARISDQTVAARNQFLKSGDLIYEFPYILLVKEIVTSTKNIAGVKVQIKEKIEYDIHKISALHQNPNLLWSLDKLKKWIEMEVDLHLMTIMIDQLEHARKKTTQKVNLYEKVQIPEFSEGIIKIKRFLEDKENLEKAAIKIVKNRKMQSTV